MIQDYLSVKEIADKNELNKVHFENETKIEKLKLEYFNNIYVIIKNICFVYYRIYIFQYIKILL